MKMQFTFGLFLTSLIFCGQLSASTTCTVAPTSIWNSGYQLDVNVSNNGATAINDWAVTLNFSEAAQITGNWNSIIAGGSTNGVAFSNAAWNGALAPGQTVSFGLHGDHDGSFVLPTCSGSGDATLIDIVAISVTNAQGQAPVKGDAIRLTMTVVNNGSESASATLTPRISSSRFTDFNNVNLPSTYATLAAGQQLEISVDAGPFVHDTVTDKHYALGSSNYTINSVGINGTLDSSFAGDSFSIVTSNTVLVPVLYDQAYLDDINYPGSIEQYLTSAFTRPSEIFTATDTYEFFPGGFDEIMNIKHVLYPLSGFTAYPAAVFCGQATAAAQTMLGLEQDWVGPVSTNAENHGFDYLIGLTPEVGGGQTCSWMGVQVSGHFSGGTIDLTQTIFIHEVGHALGAPHCDPLGGYVMCGGEHHPHYIEKGILVWHHSSVNQMSNLFD